MSLVAKRPGTCRHCGQSIKPGDRIHWSRLGSASHVRCPEEDAINSAAPQPLHSIGGRLPEFIIVTPQEETPG
jgi:hypothetical protein